MNRSPSNMLREGVNKIDEGIIYHDYLKKKYLNTLIEQEDFEKDLIQMYVKLKDLLEALNSQKIISQKQLKSSLIELQRLQQQKQMLTSRTKHLKNELISLQEKGYNLKKIENEAVKDMEKLHKDINKQKQSNSLIEKQLKDYELQLLDIEQQKKAMNKIIESRLSRHKTRKIQLNQSQSTHHSILMELNSIQQQLQYLTSKVTYKNQENQALMQEILLMKNQCKTICLAIQHKKSLLCQEESTTQQMSANLRQLSKELEINQMQLDQQNEDNQLLSLKIMHEIQQKQHNIYTIEALKQHMHKLQQVNNQIQNFLLDCYQQDDALIQLIQKRRALSTVVNQKNKREMNNKEQNEQTRQNYLPKFYKNELSEIKNSNFILGSKQINTKTTQGSFNKKSTILINKQNIF